MVFLCWSGVVFGWMARRTGRRTSGGHCDGWRRVRRAITPALREKSGMLGRTAQGGVGDRAVTEDRLEVDLPRIGDREFVARPVVALVVRVGGRA
jgi:hypothetical protein